MVMQADDQLRQLYQEVILDHSRSPRNFGKLEPHTHAAEGYNPLCGDQLELYLRIADDGRIEDVHFDGKGCAISRASASLMTEEIKGKTVGDARMLFERFHQAITSDPSASVDGRGLGKLVVLLGVREFPTRIKCATLAWHTLLQALDGGGTTSTEE
ncbi:MAG: iron-sulfur cluster assembly scaffold protein [Candidatus Kapaibacterium sp.]|nr:MAG: iron-sulfur cluster assembly scaffold protein [Candidatus Kapabacteria bacterium]